MTWSAIHRYLGLGPAMITDEMVNAIVAEQLPETADLDFKSQLPPAKGLSATDFPKDIAAMANSGGGTIVFGIHEENKAATHRADVGDFTETHERSMRSCAITAISPPIFGLDIHRIGPENNRALVVVVPASPDGPHLIYRNDLFGAPIRNDADTAWMRERQVESMYRARFDEQRSSHEALRTLYNEAATGRDTATRAWITLAAHPRREGPPSLTLDRDQAREVFTRGIAEGASFLRSPTVNPLRSTNVANPRPGLRRWVAPNDATSGQGEWKQAWAAMHHNGAVSLSAAIGGHRNSSTDYWPGGTIEGTAIEGAVADFMGLARAAGDRLGIDEFETRIGIVWTGHDELVILARDAHGFSYDGNSTPLALYANVDTTVRTSTDDDAYQRQVADIARDCVNQGGVTYLQAIADEQ